MPLEQVESVLRKATPRRVNVRGHGTEGDASMQDKDIPLGLCQCGCGERTNIAPQSKTSRGYVKGQPYRYLPGHNTPTGRPVARDLYRVDPDTGCWVWQRAVSIWGYGRYRRTRAHVVFYVERYGPVPEGLHIDHLCRNRACVNPEHLEPVTPAENLRRGDKAKLTAGQVREIKGLLGTLQQKDIAARYGVDPSLISHIHCGRLWGDI
jgi:hypothetical protein